MGTWGTAIFSNDLAADMRGDFKDLIANGKTPAQARKELVSSYEIDLNIPDAETHDFWLALSLIQWKMGRLEACVKKQALKIIDSGANLEDWKELDAAPSDIKKRGKVLQELKQTLLSPQPEAKTVKKQPANICPYKVGEVFFYKHPNGYYYLFVVISHYTDNGGTYARAQILQAKFQSEAEFTGQDLNKIPAREVNTLIITDWKSREYKRLVKTNRMGLAGQYMGKIEKQSCGGIPAFNFRDLENERYSKYIAEHFAEWFDF